MSSDVTIRISGLWKKYGLPMPRFIHRGINLIKGRAPDYEDGEWWALKDVSLEVRRGETLGIVGRNGAGKRYFAQGFSRRDNSHQRQG